MANRIIADGSHLPSPALTPQPQPQPAYPSDQSPETLDSSVESTCTPINHLSHLDEINSELSPRNRRSRAPSPSPIQADQPSRHTSQLLLIYNALRQNGERDQATFPQRSQPQDRTLSTSPLQQAGDQFGLDGTPVLNDSRPFFRLL
jgi:hypothetical protein